MASSPTKPKVWIQNLPHNCSVCEAQGIVELAAGYCPDCNALFSAKCWSLHHRKLGVKTHKAWSIQAPQDASNQASAVSNHPADALPDSPRHTSPEITSSTLRQSRSNPVKDSYFPSNFPLPATIQQPILPSQTSPRAGNNDIVSGIPPVNSQSSSAVASSSNTSTGTSSTLSKADRKAEKAARAEKRRVEKEAKQLEKERQKQEKKDIKRRNSISSSQAAPSASSAAPIPHRASISGMPGISTNDPLSPSVGQASESKNSSATSPRGSASSKDPSSVSPRNGDLSSTTSKKFKRNGSTTVDTVSPTTLSPRSASVGTSQPGSSSNSSKRADGAIMPTAMSRGQSAFLDRIGQNAASKGVPHLATPSLLQTAAVVHQPVTSRPFYCLVALESDVKPLTDQSTAGDFPILQTAEVARLLNDLSPDTISLDSADLNAPPSIQFDKLTRLAVPTIGIHGNKEEMVSFLQSRTKSIGTSLWDLFDKPGLYAVLGSSLPTDPHASQLITASTQTKKSSMKEKLKKSKQAQQPVPTGQNALYIVLWHTSDAFMQMFATSSRSLQLFAMLNAITSFRIALYSELEARYLLKLDSELITLRQDITSIKTLPETIKDASVHPRAEGAIVFGRTNVIHFEKYLMKAILSTGAFGDKKDLYEGRGARIPKISFLGGSHSISFRVSSSDTLSAKNGPNDHSSQSPVRTAKETHIMAVAVESVPNLLAQWGSDGTIDLSRLNDDEFSDLLADGRAPDWVAKSKQIADEQDRVNSLIAVPRYSKLEALLDSTIRAHLRINANVSELDMLFELSYESVPLNERHQTFVSSLPDDSHVFDHSEQADVQLLKTYGDKLQLSSLAPESAYLAALSRLALAKSALRMVRVLKNKSPDDQASFIINTMDSTEDEVNQLYSSLQGYPEFEKTHHNFFQSTNLNEADNRIRWYFISLYDNILLQTRHHVLNALSQANVTLEKLQDSRGAEELATFKAWKADLVAAYRKDLNARLTSIFDFKLLSLSATGQSTSHLVRNAIVSYTRDPTGKSASIALEPIKSASVTPVGASKATEAPLEMQEHSLLTFSSSDWMLTDSSPNTLLAPGSYMRNNNPSIRIVPASCKHFHAPSTATFADGRDSSLELSKIAQSTPDSDNSVYAFNSASLNIVVTVVTRRSKNETQIYAAGGSLVGTLPVHCTHVAFSEETMLLALCGEYVQVYRLLDGGKALSTVPDVSFYLDSKVYGVLEQVHVVGESCYFFTSVIQQKGVNTGLNGPNAPALPPRTDIAGGIPLTSQGQSVTKSCMIFKAAANGTTVRLSPPQGVAPIDSLLVLPSQSHLLLIRNVPQRGLVGELWQMDGLTVSVFVDIALNHPPQTCSSLQICSLNGVLHLVSATQPSIVNGMLDAKLHVTHLQVVTGPDELEDAKNKAIRKTSPCENYLSYFAECVLRYSPCPAILTHHSPQTHTMNTSTKPLRALVSTNDASLFAEFDHWIDRHRTLMRFAMLSADKLQVARASKLDLYHHLPKPGSNIPQPSHSHQHVLEPIVPFLHHTLLRTKQSHRFATPEYDDIAEEANLLSMASFVRALICAIPVPLISSMPRGILVASTEGGNAIFPHAQVIALQSEGARARKDPSAKKTSLPQQIATQISFGMIESLIRSWKLPTKIVTSFGSCSTGKTTFLNHLFGTLFEPSTPHISPFFVNHRTLQVDTPWQRAGAISQVGAWLSIVPSPTVLYLVVDFESILSQKPAAEQALLSVLNFSIANLTIWRTATPFLDEHFELLRSIAMEKDRLVTWSQNAVNQPMLPWPKAYNSLLIASDTSRVNDLISAKKAHYDLAKASIKHYESNPGPHMKPVMQTMVKNRMATVAMPLSLRANLGTHLAINANSWMLGPMHTNYLHQDLGFYQAMTDQVAPFLDPVISFDSGADALAHIKRHLSYVIWSQVAPIELPPRLQEVVKELDSMVVNALIFGQSIRIGNASLKPTSSANQATSKGSANDYIMQRQESQSTAEGERVTIGPLCDLSDPSKVIGCPMLEFAFLGIPDPLTTDFDRLQQYFPEEGLVLPIGTSPLPFNPKSKQDWSYYSYIDVILAWNRHVCAREQALHDSDWVTSLQLFLNMLIMRRAFRVDFWIKLHTADIPSTSGLHRKVAVLREKVAVHFDKIRSSWKLCDQPCSACFYTCTLQAGHAGNHDCLVPPKHACTSKCPKCSRQCPVSAGHRRDGILHKCPVSCQKQ